MNHGFNLFHISEYSISDYLLVVLVQLCADAFRLRFVSRRNLSVSVSVSPLRTSILPKSQSQIMIWHFYYMF